MDSLTAARWQMAVSLGFHMIFAAAGIGMPLLMLIAEGLWIRTGREHYRLLARKWAKATGLLFAVGAVSGTALSFELGLLWPKFMELCGALIGPAFALEGFAFFIEAIFLGLYLYGWEKLSPVAHWWTGVPVAVNAWMQAPTGFDLDANGKFIHIDPLATFKSPQWIPMAIHSSLSCYVAVAFAVAGIYAVGILRGNNNDYHRSALTIAMLVGGITVVLQAASGDLNGKTTAKLQPEKLAAMEALFETQAGAPLLIGGIPDEEQGTVSYAIELPKLLSFAAKGDFNATVQGLHDFPADERPPVLLVHLCFQIMVGCGVLLILLSGWYAWVRRRSSDIGSRPLLVAVVAGSPLGFLALETGWMVSELGRQPWTIYRVLRTRDAVTPVADVSSSLLIFTALYLGLAVALVFLLLRLTKADEETPRVS